MGAIFGVAFFVWLLIVGGGIAFVGLVCLIVFAILKKRNLTFAKILTPISAVIMSIGILIMLIPVGFFSFIIYVNSVPPEDFVKTDIKIEEDGYQSERFTADGVVYEALDLRLNNWYAIQEPLFYYTTSGFLNGSQCGNYYAVENSQGFDLVYGSGLFCPVTQKEEVMAYYTDPDNAVWEVGDYEDEAGMLAGAELEQAFRALEEYDMETVSETSISKDAVDEQPRLRVGKCSTDRLIAVDKRMNFLFFEDTVYLVGILRYDENFSDGVYTVQEVPEEIAVPILNEWKTMYPDKF